MVCSPPLSNSYWNVEQRLEKIKKLNTLTSICDVHILGCVDFHQAWLIYGGWHILKENELTISQSPNSCQLLISTQLGIGPPTPPFSMILSGLRLHRSM